MFSMGSDELKRPLFSIQLQAKLKINEAKGQGQTEQEFLHHIQFKQWFDFLNANL